MEGLGARLMRTVFQKEVGQKNAGFIKYGSQYMWQSQIEIKYYSVTYFERITKFDVLRAGLIHNV